MPPVSSGGAQPVGAAVKGCAPSAAAQTPAEKSLARRVSVAGHGKKVREGRFSKKEGLGEVIQGSRCNGKDSPILELTFYTETCIWSASNCKNQHARTQ